MFKKVKKITIQLLPIVLMIVLIPIVQNDYVLLSLYTIIIIIAFVIEYKKLDWIFFVFALLMMTVLEALFISTGVEVFQRNSLLGLMPIWLPVLWAYSFVVMKRMIKILESTQ